MSDFRSGRKIKAVRKAHRCAQCLQSIGIGDPASVEVASWNGDFQCVYMHPECDAAWMDYGNEYDQCGDDWPWLHDLEREDLEA